MKKIFLFLAMLSLTTLVSCSGGGPEGVAKNFLEAINKGDFEGAKKYGDEKTQSLIGMMSGMISAEDKAKLAEKSPKVEIVKTEEKDDKATVTYKVTAEGKEAEESTLDLVKVNDEWKVSMNKEGMGQ